MVVAWIGFRLAIRQDERRWSRERRAEVYIDALAEASAERDAILGELTVAGGGDREALSRLPDDRLPSAERRRLGARMLAFGDGDVIQAHNRLSGSMLRASVLARDENDSQTFRIEIETRFAELEKVLRRRLESDRLPWWRRKR